MDNAGSIRVLQKCGFALTGRGRIFAQARGEEIDEVALTLAWDRAVTSRAGRAAAAALPGYPMPAGSYLLPRYAFHATPTGHNATTVYIPVVCPGAASLAARSCRLPG